MTVNGQHVETTRQEWCSPLRGRRAFAAFGDLRSVSVQPGERVALDTTFGPILGNVREKTDERLVVAV